MTDNIEAMAKQLEEAGMVGPANSMRLLQSENVCLAAGEEMVRNVLLNIFVSCLQGVADAAIIRQQQFDIRHVARAVKQLSESAEGWRKCIDGVKALVKQLEELRDKADQRSRMLIDNGAEVPEEHRAKSAGYADAYSFCILRLKELTDGL